MTDSETDGLGRLLDRWEYTNAEVSLIVGVAYGHALGALAVSEAGVSTKTVVIGGILVGLVLSRL